MIFFLLLDTLQYRLWMTELFYKLKHKPCDAAYVCVTDKVIYSYRIPKLIYTDEVQNVLELIYDATTEAFHQ